MKKEYKEKITKEEYQQLCGLMLIAHNAYKEMELCDKAMVSIVGGDDDKYAGHLSDEYFNDSPNVKKCLKIMEIKIV